MFKAGIPVSGMLRINGNFSPQCAGGNMNFPQPFRNISLGQLRGLDVSPYTGNQKPPSQSEHSSTEKNIKCGFHCPFAAWFFIASCLPVATETSATGLSTTPFVYRLLWLADRDALKMLTVKLLVPRIAEWASDRKTLAVTVLLIVDNKSPRLISQEHDRGIAVCGKLNGNASSGTL